MLTFKSRWEQCRRTGSAVRFVNSKAPAPKQAPPLRPERDETFEGSRAKSDYSMPGEILAYTYGKTVCQEAQRDTITVGGTKTLRAAAVLPFSRAVDQWRI